MNQEILMYRKAIISLVLCVAVLLAISTLVSAQGDSQPGNQMDMGTPTPVPADAATPALPLAGDLPLTGSQTGNCPMMRGMGMSGSGNMTGMNMGNMSGMQMGDMSGMSGMTGTQGMSGMSGMQGMSGMSGMQGMQGMSGMNGMAMSGAMYTVPWYSNPWLMLGWLLLIVTVIAITVGIFLGIRWLFRKPKMAQSVNIP
jgi:flagellar basal body-associated protein FliL